MRVLIVIMALAYWGVASFAQSYLRSGPAEADVEPVVLSFQQELPDPASTDPCSEHGANDLLIAASYADGADDPSSGQRPLGGCDSE